MRRYIADAWDTLTRAPRDLARAAPDTKVAAPPGGRWPVYVAASEDLAAVKAAVAKELTPAAAETIVLRALPQAASKPRHTTAERALSSAGDAGALAAMDPPGLLYVPYPYVVPGGRFNELYGWDSYFIVLGLLRDGRVALARAQTDDQLYEVRHYGKVLNANRTYYLSRSQPPLLSRMVLAVFAATHDRAWLAASREALAQTYRFWTSPPHLAGETGLSRYFDTGTGPAPEVVHGERDAAGQSHYDRVRAYYRTHTVADYDVARYYDRAADRLTPLFYEGDRSMRESGFDPSDRWGPFGVDVIHHAPVDLNVLVAVLAQDLAEIARELGDAPAEAHWQVEAAAVRARIDRYLWDPSRGMYLDWNFETGRRRDYFFATMFWPLWAGIASSEQAARVRAHLPVFERPGGLRTSDRVTGNQWDAPFGWAPLHLFAVEGLRRYGFAADADRIATAFVSMVAEDFGRRGVIVEKYDVERRTSDVEAGIHFGYAENQVGFGWTNGVFLELARSLEVAEGARR